MTALMKEDFNFCEEKEDGLIKYEIETEKGNSGSPIIKTVEKKKYAVGIHTSGADWNFGVHLNNQIRHRINSWVGHTGTLHLRNHQLTQTAEMLEMRR